MPNPAILSIRGSRQAERVQISSLAVCRRGDLREEAQLLDLSITGVRLRTFSRPGVGQRIWIRLPLLEAIEAIVVWKRDNEAGCEFAVPLHPAVFDVVRRAK